MINDQTINGPQTTGYLERVDQVLVADDRKLDVIGSRRPNRGMERKPCRPMTNELKETCRLKAPDKMDRHEIARLAVERERAARCDLTRSGICHMQIMKSGYRHHARNYQKTSSQGLHVL
jgi:hypothetical protein